MRCFCAIPALLVFLSGCMTLGITDKGDNNAHGFDCGAPTRIAVEQAIQEPEARAFAEAMCASYKVLWPELVAIYGTDPGRPILAGLNVQADPVVGVRDKREKPAECDTLSWRCRVQLVFDGLNPDVYYWNQEVHNLFRARAYGWRQVYVRENPSLAQWQAGQAAAKRLR